MSLSLHLTMENIFAEILLRDTADGIINPLLYCVKPEYILESDEKQVDDTVMFQIVAHEENPAPYYINGKDEYKIRKLKENLSDVVRSLKREGVSEDELKELIVANYIPSRIIITKHFKILLPDINVEIKMEPLPKALFLFFLVHPEGVRFKDINNYYDEIHSIYSKITGREDKGLIENSVRSMLNPTKNSINEKCSRIKEAFEHKLGKDNVGTYIISGSRGCPRYIKIDRDLVEWENETFI